MNSQTQEKVVDILNRILKETTIASPWEGESWVVLCNRHKKLARIGLSIIKNGGIDVRK